MKFKFIDRWKRQWWLIRASELAVEFEANKLDLIHRFQQEIKEIEASWKLTKEMALQRIALEQEEIKFKIESIEGRKRELAHLDTDVKNQIKMMEAKSNPSFVWETAFTAGATKTWDLIMPLMTQNIEKLIKKIQEDATVEAIKRLQVNKK